MFADNSEVDSGETTQVKGRQSKRKLDQHTKAHWVVVDLNDFLQKEKGMASQKFSKFEYLTCKV